MISFRVSLALALVAGMVAVPAFAVRSTHKAATGSHARGKAKTKSHKLRGQQAIDTNRVTQIQRALIREHFLSGDANGQWDSTTQAAMQKYQSAHGWQTRLLPDSRALKTLGLGPDYSGALNAKDSSFTAPAPAIPSEQAAGFAAASGVASSSGVNH